MAKIGTGFSIGYAEESAWGTAASTVAHNLDPRGGMESLQGEVDHITPESLSFRGMDSAQFVAGMRPAGVWSMRAAPSAFKSAWESRTYSRAVPMLLKQIGVESVESVARKIVVIVVCPFKTMDATGSTRAILRRLAGRLLVCVASFI
jgi:hypothetical protein